MDDAEKRVKKIFGAILYEISLCGFNVQLGEYYKNTQKFSLNKLAKLEFELSIVTESETWCHVMLKTMLKDGNVCDERADLVNLLISVHVSDTTFAQDIQSFIKNVYKRKEIIYYLLSNNSSNEVFLPSYTKLRKYYKR